MSLTKVTSDVLEARYTDAAVISGTSGTISVDWSAAAIYNMANDLTGAATLNFTGFVTSDATTSSTFYKIGADYDGSSSPNMLQVECLNDSANALFSFTTATIAQSTTL